MSRFQGYVGITGAMGARFTASERAFTPILQETAKRGLIFVDDGANPRSVATRIAGGSNLPFAKADMVVDAVADAGGDRSRARAARNDGARARFRGRHGLGAAGLHRAHRQMGEGGGKPRLAARADHGGGVEGQAELRR